MFIFAHVGITLGAATLIGGAIARLQGSSKTSSKNASANSSPPEQKSFLDMIGLKSLSKFLDLRLLMIGSLVPDIVDKPLEFLGFSNGRSITHTLLISLIALFIALYLYIAQKKTWLLAIVIGMFTHLILDSMWATPQVLLWPIYGWSFPVSVHGLGFGQIKVWWNTLLTNPALDTSEGIGLAIILGMAWLIIARKKLQSFLRQGKL